MLRSGDASAPWTIGGCQFFKCQREEEKKAPDCPRAPTTKRERQTKGRERGFHLKMNQECFFPLPFLSRKDDEKKKGSKIEKIENRENRDYCSNKMYLDQNNHEIKVVSQRNPPPPRFLFLISEPWLLTACRRHVEPGSRSASGLAKKTSPTHDPSAEQPRPYSTRFHI